MSVLAAAAFLCCSCLQDKSYAGSVNEKGQPDVSLTSRDYTISVYESYTTSVEELSSLCLNQEMDGLFAVGDEGDISEIGFDGRTKKTLMTKSKHDWEGVDCYGTDLLLMGVPRTF